MEEKVFIGLVVLVLAATLLVYGPQITGQATSDFSAQQANTNAFISVWKTDNLGVSENNQIRLPLEPKGEYDFFIDWGDNTSSHISRYDQEAITHSYENPGTYTITIQGTLKGWRFNNAGDKEKILEITQWGNISLGNNNAYFHGAKNLIITAQDTPNLSETTSLKQAFENAQSLTITAANNWDTSTITNMHSTFKNAQSFNNDISKWDVSSVSTMTSLFEEARNFNQPINDWDVSSTTDMTRMFYGATSFNQPLHDWDTQSLITTAAMFAYAENFNQDLNNWNTQSLTSTNHMFAHATNYNHGFENWNISSITSMNEMLKNTQISTHHYDQTLQEWASQEVQENVLLGAGNTQYCISENARAQLINNHAWNITDAGKHPSCEEIIRG